MRSVRVRVKAKPGSSKERIVEHGNHAFDMAVREAAQDGAANARIRTILALRYQVPESRVRMRTGARSPGKTYDVILEL